MLCAENVDAWRWPHATTRSSKANKMHMDTKGNVQYLGTSTSVDADDIDQG